MPKQNSSGGKEKLGSISKAGNRYLRQMLVVGAMAVIRYAERNGTRRPWLVQLMARRTTKVAAVALANKTARMVWALMTSGERYREPIVAGVAARNKARRSPTRLERADRSECTKPVETAGSGEPNWAVHFECVLSIGT